VCSKHCDHAAGRSDVGCTFGKKCKFLHLEVQEATKALFSHEEKLVFWPPMPAKKNTTTASDSKSQTSEVQSVGALIGDPFDVLLNETIDSVIGLIGASGLDMSKALPIILALTQGKEKIRIAHQQ
jgi:hypothetical protein